MAEPEDEDFPNDYDGLDFDNIPGLQAPTIRTPEAPVPSIDPRNVVPSTVASPAPSMGSNGVEDMDSSFLAAVDALEARALSEMPRGSESLSRAESGGHPMNGEAFDSPQGDGTVCDHFRGTHTFEIEGTRSLNQIHEYSMQSLESSSINKNGKRKAEPQEDLDVRSVLAGYEIELTCPICCDLLVGAQVANPCGHTCCGECGYGWLAQNKCVPTCAVCRSSLSVRKPLLPNFSVDNFVRQHLQALARSGFPEWQERGYRRIEWNKRLESWKKQAAVRAAEEKSNEPSRLRRHQPRYYQVGDYSYAVPWLVDESIDEEEDANVARVMPRRGTRSRH